MTDNVIRLFDILVILYGRAKKSVLAAPTLMLTAAALASVLLSLAWSY